MAKKRGYTFIIVGLLFGVALGFAIREAKSRLAVALVELLDKEAFTSAGCHFLTDSIEVSLLRQRAVATNPRIECAGVPHLQFKRVIATASLREIRQHNINLKLQLFNGSTLGFTDESTIFKFIDSLSAPIAKERDTPGRYKVKLQRLTVEGLEGSETIAGKRIVATGATFEMQRNAVLDDFDLIPRIAHATVSFDTGEKEAGVPISRTIHIDNITSKGRLTDKQVEITDINAHSGPVLIAGDITVQNSPAAELVGKLQLSGTLAQFSPNISGEFLMPLELNGSTRFVTVNGHARTENLALQDVKATEQLAVKFDFDSSGRILISGIQAQFPQANITLMDPIIIPANNDNLANLPKLSGALIANPLTPYSGRILLQLAGSRAAPALRLSGDMNSAGDAASAKLNINFDNFLVDPVLSGNGTVFLTGMPALDFTLLKLEKNLLSLSLTGADKSITGTSSISLDSGPSEIALTATSALITQQVPCGVLNAALRYSWKDKALAAGEGTLKLDSLSGGCGLGATLLRNPISLPISAGTLRLRGLELLSLDKPFIVDGLVNAVTGIDVNASGTVDLKTIRGLVPNIDELSGFAEGKLNLSSSSDGINSVSISGQVNLSNVRLEHARSGVEISNVSGPILINNNIIALNNLSGNFNGGSILVQGSVNITDLTKSQARIILKNIAFEPVSNLSGMVSGDLLVEQTAGMASLSGAVTIDSGEFSDSMTLSQILRIIERAIISKQSAANNTLPELRLAVTVTGNRNLNVDTNLGSAEFAPDLQINGTLRDPQIRGAINLKSGWIGFQNRRFEINAGRLVFNPPDIEPSIELTAETILPARSGENVLVILQGRGKVSKPIISLSSDQPITERELLTLVTSGGAFSSRTRANTIGANRYGGEDPLLGDLARLHLRNFFTKLVDVDSLSISPLFNPRTGLIEPALVAEKLLAPSLMLFGESTLSGVEGISRARLQLDLGDSLALGGLVEDDPSRTGLPTELQITYTPLSRQARRVSVNIVGNVHLSEREILASLRLSSSSYVTAADTLALERELKSLYARTGFPDSSVKISCKEILDTCSAISLVIDEGAARYVTAIEFTEANFLGQGLLGQGLLVPLDERTKKRLLAVSRQQLSTDRFLTQRSKELVQALRSEGYIAARVDGRYSCEGKNEEKPAADCTLQLAIDVGSPISFTFTGNKQFGAAQFLNAIRLFERNQAFGNNTISVLLSTIERLYRERGFLFATVSYEQSIETAGPAPLRTLYKIMIDEGTRVAIAHVNFEGITPELLDRTLSALTPEQRRVISTPQIPIAEQLDENETILTAILKGRGYLAATVSAKIVPLGDTNTVDINYIFSTGGLSERITPQLTNWPTDLPVPVSISEPDFNTQLALRGAAAVSFLREAGYLSATATQESRLAQKPQQQEDRLYSDASVDSKSPDTIVIFAGERTLIKSIEVRGNSTISKSVIIDAARLKIGDPMARSTLDSARSRLLRLGLFARVSIAASPATETAVARSTNGEVIIEVLERAPRSIEVGTGLNSEFGFHLFGEAADREIFGDGRQIALRLDGYYDNTQGGISKGTASAQFRTPFVFDSNLGFSEDFRFQRFDLATLPYDLDRVSLSSFLSGAESEWTYSFGHSVIQDNLDNVASDAVLGKFDTGSVHISTVSGTVSFDNRDAPLNPQSGILLALDSKLSSQAIGSQVNFLEASPRFSWAAPLNFNSDYSQWAIAYQLRAGVREPFGSTDEVPITQRYFLGGRTTVRGYKENSIGPRGEQESAQGGRYMTNQNVELRYKPLEALALLWFFDSGSVFLDYPSVTELRHSTGFGFRYLSPVGPIGFDLGFPIARRSDEAPYRLHFSLGTIF